MKRLHLFFAGFLLLLALPFWRLQDWALVTLPFVSVIVIIQVVWALVFIFFPLNLIWPAFNKWKILLIAICFAIISWISTPFTNQATLEPSASHCGRTSYTGFFYPVRKLLSNVHEDDLEIRNQMCWVVKLIKKVPQTIPPEELADLLNNTKHKLLLPPYKYRATLPWITFLLGKYLASSDLGHGPMLVQHLSFWSQIYTEEVSARDYAWYEWPHSAIVKFEYGIIENNWENIRLEFNK